MSRKSKPEDDNDDLERAPWENGALTVDVTSVPAEVVYKNCLSDDLILRLAYIKGLASAAARASKKELSKLLEVLEPLLEDEALGVRLETLQQLQQLAKLAGSTVAPDEVEEKVVDALEQQLKPSLDPGSAGGGGMRQGSAGTGALPMVRDALLATLDAICGELAAVPRNGMLSRLQRMANAALDKPAGLGGGGGGGGGKASGDAALMALSLAAVAVRHMDPDRGGLAMAAIGKRLCGHADLRVREAVAGALPQLYGGYASYPGALEQMFEAYEMLCNDKVWSVRQSCARVVSALSELCSRADHSQPPPSPQQQQHHHHHHQQQQQQQRADELQIRLLRDFLLNTLLPTKSQWVVTAARQQAGAAIATLRPGTPTTELLPPLLTAYCAAAAAVGQGAADVRRACAESFGDVVCKAGPGCWSQLQPVLVRLLTANDSATLCSLVASAERVVRLLATATATSDGAAAAATGSKGDGRKMALYDAARQVVSGPLLDVLRNQLHLAAPAASSAMAGLLDVSPPELQLELLQLLPALREPPAGERGRCGDWRQRLSLASQLHAAMRAVAGAAAAVAASTANPEATSLIARCAVVMCGDPVWAVRQAAATQVGLMLADAVPPAASASGSGQCVGPPLGAGDGLGSPAAGSMGRSGGVGSDGEDDDGTGPQAPERDQQSPNRTDSWRGTRMPPGAEAGAAKEAALAAEAGTLAGARAGAAAAGDGGIWVGAGTAGLAESMGCSESVGRQVAQDCDFRLQVFLELSRSQRAWLGRVLKGWQGCREMEAGQPRGDVVGGEGAGGGAGGDGGGGGSTSADVTATAPELLAAWLSHATLQGSRAEQALAISCCQKAVPFSGIV